eukprot:14863-Heterococcus_DN1.PRE.2
MFQTRSRHRNAVLAVVLLSAAAVHSHPLCRDFGAPAAQAPPLQFYWHVNSEVDGSCCTAAQDAAISKSFSALIKGAGAVSEECKKLQVSCTRMQLANATASQR